MSPSRFLRGSNLANRKGEEKEEEEDPDLDAILIDTLVIQTCHHIRL